LLLISRLGDGLDGAVARQSGKTDFGGYLDIVLDFIFYGLIPLGFIIANPAQNAVAGALLIVSFIATGSSFLAFAALAEKYELETKQQGSRSLFFAVGLAEATETLAVFIAFCLFPGWFAPIAWFYSAICLFTVFARILQARETFKN
jgi:phosphatidylglycerophosphate synthase